MKYLLGTLASLIVFAATLAVMAPLQHLQCLMPVAHAQGGPPMPPPGGHPDHSAPAPGNNCLTPGPGVDTDHACACHRECRPNADEEGNATGGDYVAEDAKCRSWCHKDHCRCEIHNCD